MAAHRVSAYAAERHVRLARSAGRAPALLEALESGRLGVPHAHRLSQHLEELDTPEAAVVAARVCADERLPAVVGRRRGTGSGSDRCGARPGGCRAASAPSAAAVRRHDGAGCRWHGVAHCLRPRGGHRRCAHRGERAGTCCATCRGRRWGGTHTDGRPEASGGRPAHAWRLWRGQRLGTRAAARPTVRTSTSALSSQPRTVRTPSPGFRIWSGSPPSAPRLCPLHRRDSGPPCVRAAAAAPRACSR